MTTPRTTELAKTMSDADICRHLGWTVGTRIVGDKGWDSTTQEITAIGRAFVLGMTPDEYLERKLTLRFRDWIRVDDDHATPTGGDQ